MIEEVLTEALVAEAEEIAAEAGEGPEEEERTRRRNGFPALSWVVLFNKYESFPTNSDNSLMPVMCQAWCCRFLYILSSSLVIHCFTYLCLQARGPLEQDLYSHFGVLMYHHMAF